MFEYLAFEVRHVTKSASGRRQHKEHSWRPQTWRRSVWLSARGATDAAGVLLLAVLGVLVLGCQTLIGADFEGDYRVVPPGQLVDGGARNLEAPLKSCENRNCGSFRDEVLNIEVYCGSCSAERICVENKCTCDPVSCEDLGAECGYQSTGCNALQYCGACEQLYPNDPAKAYCHDDGKCGDAAGFAKTCEELMDQGRPAECGEVGVGETLLSCGECQGREVCSNNECNGYSPLKCDEINGGGILCGTFPDGNGGAITCGCSAGEVCATGGVCCAPRTMCPEGACGTVPDGCGGTIECGGCAQGEVCSDNVCCTDEPKCPDGVCGEVRICGKTLVCEACSGGQCCVKDEQGMGRCHTPSCPLNGLCGDDMPNGCGTGVTIDGCGCPDGLTCNSGVCECVPKTCPTDGACGQIDDGCGSFLTCGCDQGQACIDGACCTPTCPDNDACGLQPDGCGGLIRCDTCGPSEVCNNGACMTPSCPEAAVCGSNESNGVVLACLGTCSNGEQCAARDGTYTCGECAAECPESGDCGLTDLGCTSTSCPGECGVDGQVCVNRAQEGSPDNFQCCSGHCPIDQSITCGAYQDPTCPGSQTSCSGSCGVGQLCVATDGVYACKTVNCPTNARCGSNEVDGLAVQCDGSCTKANDECVKDGASYSCICTPDEDPCGDSCDTSVMDGCSAQPIACTCSGGATCVDGLCCSPLSAQAACAAEGATCGVVQEANCDIDRACGSCADDQMCMGNDCVCDPSKCAANETCNPTTLGCECDSTKCPLGQTCDSDGACTCDDDQCENGQVCNSSGLCACAQSVLAACAEADAECGPVMNECGEEVSCAECDDGWECDGNTCVCAESIAETCAAFECAGMVPNACGQMVDCTNVIPCDDGFACSNRVCVCVQSDQVACDDANAECGSVMNNCGETVDCPECDDGATCDGNECVCDETPAQACVRAGAECGDAVDACGETVPCTNTCTGQKTCVNDRCVCPQSDAAACAMADCGLVTNMCGDEVECDDLCDPDIEVCVPEQNACDCLQTDQEACGTFVCGNATNNCGDDVPCGTCDIENNEVCNPTTHQCMCSDPDPCAGRICGDVIDACNVSRSCGMCTQGMCNALGTACE
jgi:hypothetical protein